MIGDGLRKVVTLAARVGGGTRVAGLAATQAFAAQGQETGAEIGRASRAQGRRTGRQCAAGYRNCCRWRHRGRARSYCRRCSWRRTLASAYEPNVLDRGEAAWATKDLLHYVDLTAQVCDTARRRVLEGETVPNEEKILSIFEPHTELIKRGKQPGADPVWPQRVGGRGCGGFRGRLSRGRQRCVGSGSGRAGDEAVAKAV